MLDVQTYLAQTIESAYAKIPEEAYTLLTQIARELSAILDSNSTVKLTPEYEYMLESMAQTNIPDSINYYLNFPKDDPEDEREMAALFVEQLQIILQSVQSVQKEVRSLMTSNMKMHSRFIKDKFSTIASDEESDESVENASLYDSPAKRMQASLDYQTPEEKLAELQLETKIETPQPKKSKFRSFFGV